MEILRWKPPFEWLLTCRFRAAAPGGYTASCRGDFRTGTVTSVVHQVAQQNRNPGPFNNTLAIEQKPSSAARARAVRSRSPTRTPKWLKTRDLPNFRDSLISQTLEDNSSYKFRLLINLTRTRTRAMMYSFLLCSYPKPQAGQGEHTEVSGK